ncbi:MAG: hypothetical protein H5U05_11235 [Candidatus Aminicenantes bacterium]|nr:hypothetical protein [Candidatus Aminicenantes bacterium]
MREKVSCFSGFTTLGCHSLSAQFLPEEIAQREELEQFLLTAEIISYKEIGEGVTKPIWLFLKKDNVERNGVWKNPRGIQGGYLEGWQYEIAAYRLDKLLGLNMVPPTVEREFQGQKGSLQLWVQKEYSLLEVMEKKIPLPSSGPEADNWEKRKHLSRAFDALIANEDRTQQNTLYTKDWRMILIDHSRSFRTGKKFTQNLIYSEKHPEGPKLMSELPRAFVEKIKSLNFELIKSIVGEYLTDAEIEAILARKELILKAVDKLVKEKGEDKVLY